MTEPTHTDENPAIDGVLRPHPFIQNATVALLPSDCVQNHAANLHLLANGDIACVWFGGTQEGIADISIWFSRLEQGANQWSKPEKLSDDPTRSEQNPILFTAPDASLWLIWTAQISGRQDTAFVRYRISKDNGMSWGPIGTLIDEPGTFVRQPLVVRQDGGWMLPVFLCRTEPGIAWVGNDDSAAVKISHDQGRSWRHVEVPDSLGAVHMNIVPLGGGRHVAFFRSRFADHVRISSSQDDGDSWSPVKDLPLPNNNSSIQVTALADGRLAMVHNWSSRDNARERRLSLYDEIEDDGAGISVDPTTITDRPTAFWGAPRAPMTLSISADGGQSWPIRLDLEDGDGYCLSNNSKEALNRELSYPSIIEADDGRLHIAYTWFRRAIKHVSLPSPQTSPQ
ncbi:exo-alpha-sialidase [Allorhizobium sp. BGMRC 0089]|uniref:sialidase family protein n=1 Tax=Allorhizobium sonneratiae TaxID=2934936 RepID=UPI002033F8B0|nr:exo-alpha-sialidase [Allorhizobium sonneratiae]MCM2293903.1 exo-alpha-sialidase [Allorhizobium sonneratiae]